MQNSPSQSSNALQNPKSANIALWGGIIFSFLFTGIIALAGQRLETIALLPDQGAAWYYWKLPDPTFWTRASAWGFYLLHQFAIWGLIFYAQKNIGKYAKGLHRVNLWAIAANAFFILLHFIQTHIWYDGLAQDTSVFSSQGSVIVLLVWVLLMENNRRGMFFGKKLPFSKAIIRFARKYHGYFFAWAIIYTFWFHPMVSTQGHLIGFLYMFLLMLQGSLFFTRIHVNRWWMLVQEVSVAVHGTLVAVMQGNGLWPMFLFGFSGIFVITQMYGLGLSKWTRYAIMAIYIAAVLAVYGSIDITRIHEIIRVPLIEYLAAVVLGLLFGAGLWVYGRFKKPSSQLTETSFS